MRVAVTGAAGGIGRFVVRELRSAGHQVLPLDRRPSEEVEGGVTLLDLADCAATAAALAGTDAAVHLAAVPGPRHPPEEAFDPNLTTTFHLLEAARRGGVGRVVLASSIWAYGLNPPAEQRLPPELPLREEAVVPTTNGYGLSKRLLEQMGREYAAAEGLQVVCMRYPAVIPPHRLGRTGPCPDGGLAERAEAWSYVDVRDVALACRLAVELGGLGYAVLNIGAADTRSALPSEELVRAHRPEARLTAAVPAFGALYSIERARELLGYEPRHSWRTG